MKLPALKTLATYGLTMEEWLAYLDVDMPASTKEAMCRICEKWFPGVPYFVVDHEHPRPIGRTSGKARWAAMPPEERKKWVRGVICRGCNYFVLTRQVSATEHINAGKYLLRYEERRRRETGT